MMLARSVLFVIAFSRQFVGADPVKVQLAAGATVTGRSQSGVETFNGIPYALPPVGDLRLRPPQKLPANYTSNIDATGIAAACPQLLISPADDNLIAAVGSKLLDLPFFNKLTGQEDCLTISIQRPANTAPDAKLPVLFWIYGGGFALGSTNTYDGSSLLKTGIQNSQPVIFVAVNYRINGFGFLPGAEILMDGSANLGLLDQRLGLEWVADNIAEFGGDADKVTLWGESAGSFSVFYQMALFDGNATYKGRSLFRGGILNSGIGAPAERIDGPKGQATYEKVVKNAGCAGSSDTLSCLRSVNYETYYKAVTKEFTSAFSYYGTKISFLPRPDGKVLTASPEVVAKSGRYFAVPTIVGNQEDEGTLFSIFQQSIKSETDLVDYFHDNYFANAPRTLLTEWITSYTKNKIGSPFRTPLINTIYPMFKYVAALIGDQSFILGRRKWLEDTSAAHPNTPTWSYLSSYAHQLPILGTLHASDLLQIFYGLPETYATKSTRKYYFNFLYNLDPNLEGDNYEYWPRWQDNKTLLWFETPIRNSYLTDDFRQPQYEALLKLGDSARQ
ncbi:hypothetical protein PWT90_02765 [Aphanocladium album]|nr:hypothetical protein PWT90_02765 [Aphanocladium album]